MTGTIDAKLVLAGPLPDGCTQPSGPTSLSCTIGIVPANEDRTVNVSVRSRVVGATCTIWGTSGDDPTITGHQLAPT